MTKSPQRMFTSSSRRPHEQFFRNDGGRWLWDEERELRRRYRRFSVEELMRVVAESVGAKSCVSMIELAEGGYNKVFMLRMDNSAVAIARIPYPNTGPAFKNTASEVATMGFVNHVLE
jgi:hypothetical protein